MRYAIIAVAAATMMLCVPGGDAAAQLKAGTYEITGGKDGKTKKRYRGMVNVGSLPGLNTFHRVTSRGIIHGLAITHQKNVWVGAGKDAAVLHVERSQSGHVRGTWWVADVPGKFGMFQGKGNAGDSMDGIYKIRGTDPHGKRFSGMLEVHEGVYSTGAMLVVNGKKIYGEGENYGTKFVAGFGAQVWSYQIRGKNLSGQRSVDTDEMRKDEEVLKPVKMSHVKQLQAVARATCRCRRGACAEAALTEFGRFYRLHKSAPATKSQYAKIKSSSAKITKCLMKRGIAGQRVMALVSGGNGGATPAGTGGIDSIKSAACACKTAQCGERTLAVFADYIRRYKHKQVGRAEAKRIGESSKRLTQCLMAVGVKPGSIMKVLQDAAKK